MKLPRLEDLVSPNRQKVQGAAWRHGRVAGLLSGVQSNSSDLARAHVKTTSVRERHESNGTVIIAGTSGFGLGLDVDGSGSSFSHYCFMRLVSPSVL